MKFKQYYYVVIAMLSCLTLLWPSSSVDCSVLTVTKGECNPYSQALIYSKGIKSVSTIKKVTLPVPSVHKTEFKNAQRFYPFNNIHEHKKIVDALTKKISNQTLQTEHNQTLVKSEDTGIYTVVSGDILGKIAQKFSISISKILEFNKLQKSDTLKIGQQIKIPFSQKMVDAIVTAEYTIEKGDSLLSIAHKFNVDIFLLKKVNQLHSTVIQVGKKLILPLPYKMELLKKEALQKKAQKKAEEKKRLVQKKKKQYIRRKSIGRHKLRVTATAYSSHRAQTDSTPFLAAWNNRLRPGMKIIAVSRDLLSRYGLRNGTRVRISGLRGYYRVRDKMNKRFRKRIDIYMGTNRRRALRWGRRSVNIYW